VRLRDNKAARVIAGNLAGMVTAFLLLISVEMFSAIVHPFPAEFGGTQEEMCQHVARYSQWVLAVVVGAWGLTALASTWAAARVGGRGAAIYMGLLLLAGLVCNVAMLPYPMWFKVLSVMVSATAALTAVRSQSFRSPVPQSEPNLDS
jgi:hypothetical protein